MTTMDREQIRQGLLRKRRQLLGRVRLGREMTEEELDSRETAWEDAAAEQTDAWMLANLGEADLRTLREILVALRRLEGGHYGECAECGVEIEVARLRAVPATSLCGDCAFAAEGALPAHTD
jgi:DnaK suppressor protein